MGVVTFLFTDLVGSTEILERLGDDAAEELRRTHFRLLRQAVSKTGGQEVKNLGDGLMVAFSSPMDAIRGAVNIQRAVDKHNQAHPERSISVRIGLHAGEPLRDENDFFGTSVVIAKRLCDRAEGAQILVSELVAGLVGSRGGFRFDPVGRLPLKGLAQPLAALAVQWQPAVRAHAKPGPTPPIDEAPGEPSLPSLPVQVTSAAGAVIGRDQELERLLAAFEKATAGARQLVLLGGDPGIGKTRLAVEAARRAHDQGAIVLYGRCDEELAVSYEPFVHALSHLVRHTAHAELSRTLGRFPGELPRLVPEIAEQIPGLPPPLQSDPETERYRLFDAVTSWIATASERAPVVLVLDDIHWGNKPTTLLLRHIVQAIDPMRVLVLATYRETDLGQPSTQAFTEFLGNLGRPAGLERISLTGLDEAGTEAFIAAYGGHELSEGDRPLVQAIRAQTEGNPFFTGEVLRHLVESGALYQREGRWSYDVDVADLGIPDTVREVVRHRLSRLTEEAKQTLTVASVVGLEFDFELLTAAGDLDEERLLTALEEAIDTRLIVELPGPVPRFRFAHVLVRVTLYDDVTRLRRIRLHRRVGEAVEEVYGSRLEAHLPELAHHFAQVVAPVEVDKAVEYATLAGEQAQAQLAQHQAARYFRQALDLLEAAGAPDKPVRADLLTALGRALWGAGEIDAAKPIFLEAATLARQLGDAGRLAQAALGYSGSARPWWASVGEVDKEAVALLSEAVERMDAKDSHLRVRVMGGLARELYFEHVPARREELSLEAVAMARRLGDPAALASAMVARHTAGWTPDNVEERLAIAAEIIELAGQLGDTELILAARVFRCLAFLQTGDRAAFDAEVDVLARQTDELRLPFYLWLTAILRTSQALMGAHLDQGQMLAINTLETGNQAQEFKNAAMAFGVHMYHIHEGRGRLGDLRPTVESFAAEYPGIPAWRAALLTVAAQAGDRDSAVPIFEDFAADGFVGVPRDWVWHVAMFRLVTGCVFLEDAPRAEILYDLLLPFAGHTVVVSLTISSLGPVSLQLGQLAAVGGRWDTAASHFEDAIAEAEAQAAPGWAALAQYEWGRALLGRPDGASQAKGRELLEVARQTAAGVGWDLVVDGAATLLSAAG